MIRKTARATIAICDWMMGYHGQELTLAAQAAFTVAVTMAGITAMFLATC